MIRNIIWDVDGTLFDTYPAIAGAFQAAVRDFGAEVPLDWITQQARISLGRCVRALSERCGLDEAAIGQKFDEYYSQVTPEDQPPFPGVIKICQHICALGGKNVIVTHRGRRGLTELLQAHQMSGYFSGSITRDDGYPKKPDPAAFEAAVAAHQLHKAETITIGDREIDILAGQAAGVFACLFDPDCGETSAELSVRDLADVYGFLTNK